MGLPSFDPPAEVSIGKPFWNAIRDGVIRLPQCSTCSRWQWYPDETGTCCPGADYRWVDVEGRGTLFTMTTVHRNFLPDDAQSVPYRVGLLELDGVDGVRLVGNLEFDEDWAIGDRVRPTFPEHGDRRHLVFVHE